MNLGEPVRVVEVVDEPMRFLPQHEEADPVPEPVPEPEPEPVPA